MNHSAVKAKSYLVVGYGNDLRSDDGVGQRVAEVVATWEISNVRSLAMHQLTPELAAELADVDVAIFVDACDLSIAPFLRGLGDRRTAPIAKRSPLAHATLLKSGNPPTQVAPLDERGEQESVVHRVTSQEVRVIAIEPSPSGTLAAHSADPRSLLALTQAVYGRIPQAWWVLIPGENFELGDRLSPLAETGMAIALEEIAQLLAGKNLSLSSHVADRLL
jgi:Ni,Fe-hydrogenase maturation factor